MKIGWPVPLLKKIMSSADISEAMAYERIQPFGEGQEDFRTGMICATIANVNGSGRGKTFKPSDFMPNYHKQEDKEKTLSEQIKEVFNVVED